MEQIEPFVYRVRPGEAIRVEISPHGLSAMVRAAQNGQAIAASGTAEKPAFDFTISEPVGNSHFMMVWYQFPANTPNDARYEVMVHGAIAGQATAAVDRPITNRGPSSEPIERRLTYDFRVV